MKWSKITFSYVNDIGPSTLTTEDNSGCSVRVNISQEAIAQLLPGYDELHCALGMCNPGPDLGMTVNSL